METAAAVAFMLSLIPPEGITQEVLLASVSAVAAAAVLYAVENRNLSLVEGKLFKQEPVNPFEDCACTRCGSDDPQCICYAR